MVELCLGCGAGINLLVAAVCNPQGHFLGVDFNHNHIITAREVAQKAGIKNIEFIESSFDAFAKQKHGGFDFIVSHGVWFQELRASLHCKKSYMKFLWHQESAQRKVLVREWRYCVNWLPKGTRPVVTNIKFTYVGGVCAPTKKRWKKHTRGSWSAKLVIQSKNPLEVNAWVR